MNASFSIRMRLLATCRCSIVTRCKAFYGSRLPHKRGYARLWLRARKSLLIEVEGSAKLFPLRCVYERHIEPLIEERLVVNFWRTGGEGNKGPQQSPD